MNHIFSKFTSVSLGFLIVVSLLLLPGQSAQAAGSVSIDAIETAYTENFDSLGWAGGGPFTAVPNGWWFLEIGKHANTTYFASDGSTITGNTYSYGLDTDRAFGGLRDAKLATILGAEFTNNVGFPINSLTIDYTGEQWRLGAIGSLDRLDFQYSTNAASIDSGTWTDLNTLDFTAPVTAGLVGALNGNAAGNRTTISAAISGLNLLDGSSIWIRWVDYDSSAGEDGLAVDDFSITAHANEMPPYVISTVPANSAAGVAANADLVVTFSEPVNLGATWYSLTCAVSGVHAASVSGGPTTFTLNPGTDFSYGELCTAIIYSSEVTDQDLVDPPDAMLSNYSWSFSIGNDIPVANNQSVATDEDTNLSITLTATDVYPGSLTWHYTSPADGTLSGTAPNLTYAPNADFNGTDSFTFYVNDGYANSNTATVDITVNPVNDPPILTNIGSQSVAEGSPLTFTATATDIDLPADTLTFSLVGTPPDGASITAGGVFTWTPSEAQGPGSYPITIKVCDDGTPVECDSETITVTVAEVNEAPVLAPIGNKSTVELTLLTFTATAADADLPANTLTFSLIGGPAGAAIDPATGGFTWTPSEAQVGDHIFTVKVCDDAVEPLCDQEQITVTVLETLAITSLDLRQSTNKTIWTDVYGSFSEGYKMGLDPVLEFEYLDVKALTTNRPLGDGEHPFYLDTASLPAGFYEYWALKGVDSTATGWQGWMYQIITGNEPMFYLQVNGSSYKLTDGLEWDFFATEEFLRISGDYPLGVYTFDGTITTDLGDSSSVSATMTFEAMPRLTALTLKQSLDKAVWIDVFGSLAGYRMDLNGNPVGFEYLDVNSLTSNKPLKIGLHPFYLGTVDLPAGFYAYWDLKGVNSSASAGTWQAWMYQIITGKQPMFYLKVSAGPVYKLIDGLEWDFFTVEEYLRVSGDYPLGSYLFNGILEDQILETKLVTSSITFEALPEITSLTLAESVDKTSWTPLTGSLLEGYEMALDILQPFQYINVASLSANKLLAETLHPFYLNTVSLPAGYYEYWDAKGVNSSAGEGTWQAWMYQIVTASKPMFYLKVSAGPIYKLIDGLSLDFFGGEEYLRVSGDYPIGAYSFDGTITDQIGESSELTAEITFTRLNHPPVLDLIGNKSVDEGSLLTFTAFATDVDLPAQTLTFSLDGTPPAGASITAAGAFTWIPTEEQGPGSYPITVKVCDDGSPILCDTEEITVTVNELSSAKDILTFTIPTGITVIDQNAKTITVTVPFGTDVTNLAPTITVSEKATVNPLSGAVVDFTNPVIYTVTAEDGTTQDYTVTVVIRIWKIFLPLLFK